MKKSPQNDSGAKVGRAAAYQKPWQVRKQKSLSKSFTRSPTTKLKQAKASATTGAVTSAAAAHAISQSGPHAGPNASRKINGRTDQQSRSGALKASQTQVPYKNRSLTLLGRNDRQNSPDQASQNSLTNIITHSPDGRSKVLKANVVDSLVRYIHRGRKGPSLQRCSHTERRSWVEIIISKHKLCKQYGQQESVGQVLARMNNKHVMRPLLCRNYVDEAQFPKISPWRLDERQFCSGP